jgi:hypothetical protein
MNSKEKYVLEHYDIREDGTVYSPYTKKILKTTQDKDGYYCVTLIYDDKSNRQPFWIHRLVALKYIPEIEGYTVVNHKDLNKQNNDINNLEWSTISKNTQHGYDNCAYEHIQKIKVTDKEGNITIYPNCSDLGRKFGYKTPATLSGCLKKNNGKWQPKKGKYAGFTFEYTDESVTTIERVASTDTSE